MLLLITLEREKGRMLSLQHFPSSVSLSGIKHLAAIEACGGRHTHVRFGMLHYPTNIGHYSALGKHEFVSPLLSLLPLPPPYPYLNDTAKWQYLATYLEKSYH